MRSVDYLRQAITQNQALQLITQGHPTEQHAAFKDELFGLLQDAPLPDAFSAQSAYLLNTILNTAYMAWQGMDFVNIQPFAVSGPDTQPVIALFCMHSSAHNMLSSENFEQHLIQIKSAAQSRPITISYEAEPSPGTV